MAKDEKSVSLTDLEESIDQIRIRRGCNPISNISKARVLFDFIEYKNSTVEQKVRCLTALIKLCFEDDIHRAGSLLAALTLLKGYEAPTTPDARLDQYQKLNIPDKSMHIKRSMLIKRNKDDIKRFVAWLINRKSSGELHELIGKLHNEKSTISRAYKHNLPRRNLHYVDRKEQTTLINDIWECFNSNAHSPNEQLIYGIGGAGKTQVANEYAHRFSDKYTVVCWITPEAILNSTVEFIKYMEPEEYKRIQVMQDSSTALAIAFRQWFENNTNWLLIIDDIDDIEEVTIILPQNPNGHILLTSRLPIKSISKSISIDVFDEETAVEFLLDRTKSDNEHDARKLAIRLGCFPLALEQAAAYIVAWPDIDFQEYISLLKDVGLEVFDEDCSEEVPNYNHTISSIFDTAIRTMDLRSAQYLMCFCAYFSSEPIDFTIFTRQEEILKELYPDDPEYVNVLLSKELASDLRHTLKRRKVIAELTKYSLIKYDYSKNTFTIHRLIQEVLRAEMAKRNLNYLRGCLTMIDVISELAVENTGDSLVEYAEDGKSATILDDATYDTSTLNDDEHKSALNKIVHIYSILNHGLIYLPDDPVFIDAAWHGFMMVGAYLPGYDDAMNFLETALKYMGKAGVDDPDVLFPLAIVMGRKYIAHKCLELYDTLAQDTEIQCKREEDNLVINCTVTLEDIGKVELEPLFIELPEMNNPRLAQG